jgi:hypothetical protein
MIAEDRPAKGGSVLRWANGDAGRVNLPSVAGVPLGRRRYVWLGPKVCLILTRIKGGWSTTWRPPSPGGPKMCLILTRIKGGWSATWRPRAGGAS